MTAARAYETSSNKRFEVTCERYETTKTYVEEILHRQICYAAMFGKDKLVHILPAIKFDREELLDMLNNDEYVVKLIGRILIIKW